MKYRELTGILDETGLSPEKLAQPLGVSNLTLRRWRKRPPDERLPAAYDRTVEGGICRLLAKGALSPDSKNAARFLDAHLPEFFSAVIAQFRLPEGEAAKPLHQDRVTAALFHIGNSARARAEVDDGAKRLRPFQRWGREWRDRLAVLTRVLRARQLTSAEKLVAYGALFYLLMPADLVPDQIPVFGYVDDFGMLGIAAAHYMQRYPKLAA